MLLQGLLFDTVIIQQIHFITSSQFVNSCANLQNILHRKVIPSNSNVDIRILSVIPLGTGAEDKGLVHLGLLLQDGSNLFDDMVFQSKFHYSFSWFNCS